MRSNFTIACIGRRRRSLGTGGAAAVELGLALPFLVLLVIGIIDFGTYLDGSQALAAATRVGAEFARDSTTCKAGIQVLSNPQISAACVGSGSTGGIEGAVQNAANFNPALTFPNPPALTCQCDDGTSIACGNNSCATAGRPAPNRVFVTVRARQTFSPIIPWPGFPTVLNGTTVLRLQ